MADGHAHDEAMTNDLARDKVRQVFRYLKAFAEQNATGERRLSETLRHFRLASFPAHPAVQIGEVVIGVAAGEPKNGESRTGEAKAGESFVPIRIRKPLLTKPPTPPLEVKDWLLPGWASARGSVSFLASRNEVVEDETVTVQFADDPVRCSAAVEWESLWLDWAEAEKPALEADEVFSKFFELHGHIQRDGERVELVLGDGRLLSDATGSATDFPVLLQRVELRFDPEVPEFLVEDADRAPELYGALLQECDALRPERLKEMREEAESQGLHPLERSMTTAYLRRLAALLGPNASFAADWESSSRTTQGPQIVRDPVLLLRRRWPGFPRAFDEVLTDLERNRPIPQCLESLVGKEGTVADREGASEEPAPSPWTEPLDTLFSKPANAEQIRIARVLDRHPAVLVQGPPGTGKSHTIANLIGHLVAQGKRVLVTSHTAKALRVLRGHVAEPLRPLCLAVLDTDLDGRKQLEEAVSTIVGRLTSTSDGQLALQDQSLTREREALSRRILDITRDLGTVRQLEYEQIVVAGVAFDPAKAARRVSEFRERDGWIPGQLEPGGPLPLSAAEVAALYETNGDLAVAEERELTGPLPTADQVPSVEDLRQWVEDSKETGEADASHLWTAAPAADLIPAAERLNDAVRTMLEDLDRMRPWQVALVRAGYDGENDANLWRELRGVAEEAALAQQAALGAVVKFDPEMDASVSVDERIATLEEIREHLTGGGSLGWMQLTMHRTWKRFIESARVNGQRPTGLEHFEAFGTMCVLEVARAELARRWDRQAAPIGLPPFAELGPQPEPKALDYVRTFEDLLTWWDGWWPRVDDAMLRAGFRYTALREQELASGSPQDPFDRDVSTLRNGVVRYTAARLGAARKLRATQLLDQLARALGGYTGDVVGAIRGAVRTKSVEDYEQTVVQFGALRAKRDVLERRQELLKRLETSAPDWARAIRLREGVHAGSAVPGDPGQAWTWKQLSQELNRRAELDEHSLQKDLERSRSELLRVTGQLIEVRTWYHQLRRTDLRARQALQGWADTQRRIGKGTGKRVPELQLQARRLLDEARHAVPVWIMPLSRVAESFHPSTARFDVAIIDEASQVDIQGLLVWYLCDKIAIVGDHEQVSPLAVGQRIDAAERLIAEHLLDVPNGHLYDGRTSVYDLARQSFGGLIALREHFRCVPDIIEFSNNLCYQGEIRPLRDPSAVPLPHVAEYVVGAESGPPTREGKANLAEARAVVALMKAVIEQSTRVVSVGVVSLLGDEQAALVMEIAARVVGAVELEAHRFLVGNAAQFQGDERDVMFLSMVDVPQDGPLPMREIDSLKQRYNVAASRARDQLWLVHSLDPNRDLKPGDLRRLLIEHVRDPRALRLSLQASQQRAESEFERQVIGHLVREGFEVQPQVWVGSYRIDMVVGPETQHVAIECDGDRYHPIEQIPADMMRQAVLERSKWRFIRVRGTRYFRDVEGTMRWVVGELERLGVPRTDPSTARESKRADGQREAIARRAWEIMREQGWLREERSEEAVDATLPGGSGAGNPE